MIGFDDALLASEHEDIVALYRIGERIGYGRARQVLASIWDAKTPGIAKAHGEDVVDPRCVDVIRDCCGPDAV